MSDLRGVRRTVPPRLTRGSADADVDAEMTAHLEQLAEELVEQGWDPDDAVAEAARRFGDADRLRAEVRDIDAPRERSLRRSAWLGSVGQDLRYWARQLGRSPGHAAVTILTLALGIGLTTSMFTVVNGVLLRPLPFPEPEELVSFGVASPDDVGGQLNVRDEHFAELEREMASFAAVGGYMVYPPTTLTGAGDPARMTAAWVTAGFFRALGVGPALGRDFDPSEHEQGVHSVVILGHDLWVGRFGADEGVIGRTATLDGVPRTVVGVMPPGVSFPGRTDLWLPLQAHPMLAQGLTFGYATVGRLADGVSPAAARSELAALGRSAQWRINGEEPVSRVVDLQETIVGDSRYRLMLFSGAVALLLLIACTNVANLLLMRATAREQEIGLRMALGAGRRRLLRQLLTESVVVACVGGALGVGVAAVGVRGLLALAPAGAIPRDQELGLDPVVLGFALAVSVATGIAFGLVPALKSTRRGLRDTLSQGSRTHSGGGGLARGALVVTELALAVVLLTGAGLLLRSFQEVRSIDLGFDPEGALTFYVDLPADAYATAETTIALHERVLEGLGGISGVEVAGGANFEPFGPLSLSTRIRTEDGAPGRTATGWTTVSPGYFRAMDISVLSGRGFQPTDDAVAPPVAVLSRTLARQLWPDREAVGKRLLEGDGASVTVVGVVGDVVESDVLGDQRPLMYRPFTQNDYAPQLHHMSYVVRTDVSAAGMAAAMREVVREADPDIPVGSVVSMDDVVLDSLGDRVFQMRVLGAFAILAMLLAAVGVYGVTAYSVSQRMRELGIRVAMGARGTQVAALTLRKALGLTVVGLLIGGGAAVVAARLIAASLYQVTPSDPVTLVVVALVLGGVAVGAALIPARRASRVDPVEVLGA